MNTQEQFTFSSLAVNAQKKMIPSRNSFIDGSQVRTLTCQLIDYTCLFIVKE